MQNGSLIRAERKRRPAVWESRWRELAGNGKRTHRRIVLGSVDRLVDEVAARQAVSALCLDINVGDARIEAYIATLSDLAEHYTQRELKPNMVLETVLHEGDVRGLSEQMDSASVGKLPLTERAFSCELGIWLWS